MCRRILSIGVAMTAMTAMPQLCSASVVTFNGNGNSGFGGSVGEGSLTFSQVENSTLVDATFTRGAGTFNDEMVIYIDSTSGGILSTEELAYEGTPPDNLTIRRAISGTSDLLQVDADLVFANDFAADYAIALSAFGGGNSYAGLWALGGAELTELTPLSLDPNASPTDPNFSFQIDVADLQLEIGESFNFVATYLNGNLGDRSDEFIGSTIAIENDQTNTITLAGFDVYVTAIPEPSSVLMLGGIVALVIYRVCRRRIALAF